VRTKLDGNDPTQQYAFDHIYVDLNQIVHVCALTAKNEEHLFFKLFKHLDRLFAICCPKKSIYLVLDGPASKAKMLEQRRRRYKTAMRSEEHKNFDPVQITPGTHFMFKLKNSLIYYISSRLPQRKYRHVKFYLSGSDVAGEGEIKIVNYIHHKPKTHKVNDSYLIVGTDADLILLGLCVTERNVFVLARTKKSAYNLLRYLSRRFNFVCCQNQ
jgi:5'-3' exonuclease